MNARPRPAITDPAAQAWTLAGPDCTLAQAGAQPAGERDGARGRARRGDALREPCPGTGASHGAAGQPGT